MNEQQATRIKCNCACHTNRGIKHFAPCCNNGYIDFPGKVEEKPKEELTDPSLPELITKEDYNGHFSSVAHLYQPQWQEWKSGWVDCKERRYEVVDHVRLMYRLISSIPATQPTTPTVDVEQLAEAVHDSWWENKKANGFHAPIHCQSDNHMSYRSTDWKNRERFDDHFDERKYKWCDKCHPDMIPYGELSNEVQEYDRVTVKTVLSAIEKTSYTHPSKQQVDAVKVIEDERNFYQAVYDEHQIECDAKVVKVLTTLLKQIQ